MTATTAIQATASIETFYFMPTRMRFRDVGFAEGHQREARMHLTPERRG